MIINYQDICLQVCQVAREAGAFIAHERENFTADKIEYKGFANLVSYVDKASEQMIVRQLRQILPQSRFITEEQTQADDPTNQESLYTWIIDPLDGTTNFVHGMPPYCVSLALMYDQEVVVGVVYEITIGECFYAWKDGEAHMNGKKISVSKVDKLEESLVVTGLAYNCEEIVGQFVSQFDYFNRHTHGTRRLGSAATDLVYVAAGRCEAFYQANLSPWDVAAGAFIVQQAGGTVSDFSGGDNYIFGREVIATNSKIYQTFRQHLK